MIHNHRGYNDLLVEEIHQMSKNGLKHDPLTTLFGIKCVVKSSISLFLIVLFKPLEALGDNHPLIDL